jgi:hypothetical protein
MFDYVLWLMVCVNEVAVLAEHLGRKLESRQDEWQFS